MGNCRRVRLGEWKQCPLGAWLDVDQVGRKKQTLPKHMATSLQKIQTWLKIVTTNRKHTSLQDAVPTYSYYPDFCFWMPETCHLQVRPEASHKVLNIQLPWNSASVSFGIDHEVSFIFFVAKQSKMGSGVVFLMVRWHSHSNSNYLELTLHDSELLSG